MPHASHLSHYKARALFLPNLALVALPSVAFTTPLGPRAQQVVREAQQPVSAGICVKICSAHLQPTFCLFTLILPGLRAHVGQRLLAKDSAEQSSARRKRLQLYGNQDDGTDDLL